MAESVLDLTNKSADKETAFAKQDKGELKNKKEISHAVDKISAYKGQTQNKDEVRPRKPTTKDQPTVQTPPPIPSQGTLAKGRNGKIIMEDVKKMPKLTGPVDELKEMDIVNFRRLSQDATEAADKIRGKINFLEEENYSKRLSGIKAWRESPVNKLYIQIGQASISKQKNIDDVISERKEKNEDYLSKQEFDAVMTLNKSLRF